MSDDPWVYLGIDTFWNAIDGRWMEHGPLAGDGFRWTEDARIVAGPVGQRLAAGMRAAVAAVAHADNDVLVDDVFIDPTWLDEWRAVLAGIEWRLVGVIAPVDVLQQRETARGNRIPGEAAAQVEVIHRGIEYDLTVDTSIQSPEECAEAILTALAH
jgi:chloramphenicol 3-O phosphotransferase